MDNAQNVIVVSGLPRSGTSMMMRMLAAAGIPILTDHERAADADNPRGYFELEAVKRTAADASWLQGARGQAVKVVSALLETLPADYRYRVIFMRRSLDEVLASQATMLARRGEASSHGDDAMKETLARHVADVEALLRRRPDMDALFVSYARTVSNPTATARRVAQFIGGPVDVAAMARVVEPGLYRNRSHS